MNNRALMSILVLISATMISGWVDFKPPLHRAGSFNNDPESIFYQELFELPDSASTEDSLRALHLPPPHPMAPGQDIDSSYVYVTGRVLEAGPILAEQYPELFIPGTDQLHLSFANQSALRIVITEVLAGFLPADTLDVLSFTRTPSQPRIFEWKCPLIRPGAEFAGLLLMHPTTRLTATPILHGSSIFVFSSPQLADRLDDFRPIVLDLYRRSAAAMAAAQ